MTLSLEIEAAASAETLSQALRKHGTFFYDAAATIHDYGSVDHLVKAMNRADMTHAWVRIHGTSPYDSATKKLTKNFIQSLQQARISVAGWGWCQGADIAGDIKMAVNESKFYGLVDYVADIEHGHHNAKWDESGIRKFCSAVRKGIPGSFAITTFPLIDWHEPKLMTAAVPYVDAFAPQVYWFHFPNKKMVGEFHRPDGTKYSADDPAQYADLCLDRWIALLGPEAKPLILTGQAYWGEGNFTQHEAEQKLHDFLTKWNGYSRVVAVNWWHFGGPGAMTHRMLEDIVDAKLGQKPYAAPEGAFVGV